MTVFLRLLLAHLLTDFAIFREETFNFKRRHGLPGHLLHVAVYILCIILFCFPYMNMVWVSFKGISLNGWQLLPALALAHAAIDIADGANCARYATVRFVLWQIAAMSLLFLVFPALGTEQVLGLNEYWESFLLICVGGLFATYFILILVYFIEKDLTGSCDLIMDVKYTRILSSLALYLLILAPGFTGWLFGALWLVFIALADHGLDVSPARKYAGLPLTVITAAIVKIFI